MITTAWKERPAWEIINSQWVSECLEVRTDLTLKSLGLSVRHWLLTLPPTPPSPPLQSRSLWRHHRCHHLLITIESASLLSSWLVCPALTSYLSSNLTYPYYPLLCNHSLFHVIIGQGTLSSTRVFELDIDIKSWRALGERFYRVGSSCCEERWCLFNIKPSVQKKGSIFPPCTSFLLRNAGGVWFGAFCPIAYVCILWRKGLWGRKTKRREIHPIKRCGQYLSMLDAGERGFKEPSPFMQS